MILIFHDIEEISFRIIFLSLSHSLKVPIWSNGTKMFLVDVVELLTRILCGLQVLACTSWKQGRKWTIHTGIALRLVWPAQGLLLLITFPSKFPNVASSTIANFHCLGSSTWAFDLLERRRAYEIAQLVKCLYVHMRT